MTPDDRPWAPLSRFDLRVQDKSDAVFRETALEWKFPESIQRRSCGRCRHEKMVLEIRGSHAAMPGVQLQSLQCCYSWKGSYGERRQQQKSLSKSDSMGLRKRRNSFKGEPIKREDTDGVDKGCSHRIGRGAGKGKEPSELHGPNQSSGLSRQVQWSAWRQVKHSSQVTEFCESEGFCCVGPPWMLGVSLSAAQQGMGNAYIKETGRFSP